MKTMVPITAATKRGASRRKLWLKREPSEHASSSCAALLIQDGIDESGWPLAVIAMVYLALSIALLPKQEK